MNEKEVDLFYDNHYFKLNKRLQIITGLWPYKSRTYKLGMRILVYVILFFVLIPLCNGFRTWCGVDLDICGENTVGITYASMIYMKYWVTTHSEKKLKNVYKQVAQNWTEITDPREHKILEHYARQGRIKTIGYTIYMVAVGMSFCHIPVVYAILDIIMPLNESQSKSLTMRDDSCKNFYKLYIYFIISSTVTITIIIAIDTTYTVVVHQILGIFSIVKHRLQWLTASSNPKNDDRYYVIIKAIHLHKDALQFIDLIETSYSFSFLILIGITVIFITIGAFVIMTQTGKILNIIRLNMVVIGASLHFLYICWPGQQIIDHSHEMFLATYANEWYTLSERSKTLLRIIMLRCMKPCVFTAGGLYIMNLENFGSIMESAVSYIAVVASLR